MSKQDNEIDWNLTTWEGSRRETLRRWCKLSVRERLQALEEMCDLARQFADMREQGRFRDLSKIPGSSATGGKESGSATGGAVQEQRGKYDSKADGLEKPDNREGDDSTEIKK